MDTTADADEPLRFKIVRRDTAEVVKAGLSMAAAVRYCAERRGFDYWPEHVKPEG